MSWRTRKKKEGFFVTFIVSEENFLKICVLSQCTAYWISFQSIHTFTYQNTSLHALSLLVSKIVESIQCILNINIPDLFLPLLWRLGPSSKSFDGFDKITIKYDLLIFSHDVYYFRLSHCTPLTLKAPISQNGQTHSNNSSPIWRRIVWMCLAIL